MERRWRPRYIVVRDTRNSSASSACVGSPASCSVSRCFPAYRISRVLGAAAKTEHYPLGRQLVGDVLASGRDRASRSSLVTTSVSPPRQAAIASRSPGRARFAPVSPWSTKICLSSTPKARRAALGSEVLVVRRDSRIADLHSSHEDMVAVIPPDSVGRSNACIRGLWLCIDVWIRLRARGFLL